MFQPEDNADSRQPQKKPPLPGRRGWHWTLETDLQLGYVLTAHLPDALLEQI